MNSDKALISPQKPWMIWMAMLAVYLAWGSTYLAIRFAVESMPPFLMAGTRYLLAGSVFYGLGRLRREPAASRVEWRSAAIVGLLLLLGGNGGVTWSEQRIPSGIAALVIGSTPIWITLLDALNPRGRKPGWQVVLGVLFGFGGVILLIDPASLVQGNQVYDLTSMLVLLLSAFLWAVGSLYSREAHLPRSALMNTGLQMLAGAAGLWLMATFTGEWSLLEIRKITTLSAGALLYLIVVGSMVGYAAYIWLLRNAPTPLVATYAYVNPMIAIVLGSALAQEVFTARSLVAGAIIISSVVVINLAKNRQPASTVASSPAAPGDQ